MAHGDTAAELHERDELTLFFTGQIDRSKTRPVEPSAFIAAMRSLLARHSRAASGHAQAEVQREIDLLVCARAEKIAEQREEIARKAGLMQAGKRVRNA